MTLTPPLSRRGDAPLVPDGDAVAGAKLLGAVLEEPGGAGDDAAGERGAAVAVDLRDDFFPRKTSTGN